MTQKKINICLLFCISISTLFSQGILSPDQRFNLKFDVKEGVASYTLDFDKKEVVKRSRLGFELLDTE
ncbi:MAG: glycoside hydrolase family 97 N-terminal domain-containing protein, partial [Bacteroidota bacterium]